MTDPVVHLEPDRTAITPGAQGQVTVTVDNVGRTVEGYRLEVLGEAGAWSKVVPSELDVYPQQSARALVVLTPPAGVAVPSGALPFAVRAVSTEDETVSAVAEGDLDIGEVLALRPSLLPVNSSGRWSGKHVVRYANWSNSPLKLRLTAGDPDQRLGFLVHPDVLDLPVGAEGTAGVRVRATRPFLRGTPVRSPFSVRAEPEGRSGPSVPDRRDADRPVLEGVFTQKPILSRGAVGGALVLAVAAIGAGLLLSSASADPPPPQGTPGAPPPPTGLTATASGADTVDLRWESAPSQRLDGYRAQQVEPATGGSAIPAVLDAQDVAGDLAVASFDGLAPGQEHCFQLVAVKDDVGSLPSNVDCATTDPAAGSTPSPPPVPPGGGTSGEPGTTPSDSASPGEEATTAPPTASADPTAPPSGQPPAELPPTAWLVAVGFGLEGRDAERERQARTQADAAAAKGVVAGVLRVDDYPQLRAAFPTPEFLAYAGPFADEAQAAQVCREPLAFSAAECTARVRQAGAAADSS